MTDARVVCYDCATKTGVKQWRYLCEDCAVEKHTEHRESHPGHDTRLVISVDVDEIRELTKVLARRFGW